MKLMFVALFLAGMFTGVALAERQQKGAKDGGSSTLTRIQKAVEGRFRALESTSTVRLRYVTVTPRSKGGAILEVALTPPTPEKFEFHAENAYILVWQALMKEDNSFKQLGRVRVSLQRSRQMTIECPVKVVEDSNGYTDFARLKRLCEVS